MKLTKHLALLGLLSACQSSVEQQKSPSGIVAADTVSAKAVLTRPIAQASRASTKTSGKYDTLRVSNDLVLHIIPGRKTDFAHLPTEPKQEITETHLIRHQANGRVQREGNILTLTLDNGKPVIFTNDTYQLRGDENEEWDKYYHYRGNLRGLPYWIVEKSLYEAQNTLLVNQQTGVKTVVTGEIELSPDHTRLLTSYAGMVYEDDTHKLQLFAINRKSIHLLWQRALTVWAPSRTRWLNNNTVAVEQLYPTASDSISFSHPTYVRLQLP